MNMTNSSPGYIGLTGAMWGLGTVLGPVIGGAFTDSSAGWRWAFYINLPIGALIAPVLVFLIPTFDAQKGKPYLERFKQIDWIGTILLTGTIVSLILALTFGGNEYAWNSGQVIGTFVAFGIYPRQTLLMKGSFFCSSPSVKPCICHGKQKNDVSFLLRCYSCAPLFFFSSSLRHLPHSHS